MKGADAISEPRATAFDGDSPFVIGEWRIEPALRRASNGGNSIKIDPRNLRVLQVLAERAGTIVSAREIESRAWSGVVVTSDSVYQSIRQLRRALGDTKSPAKYIENVPRRGYRLVVTVALATDNALSTQESHSPASSSWWDSRRIASGVAIAASFLALALGSQFERAAQRNIADAQLAASPVNNASRIEAVVNEESAGVLRNLGGLALARGNPQEALRLFERALHEQSKVDRHNAMVAQILVELARTHFWMDNHVAALDAGKQALAILERETRASHPERVLTYSVLSEVLIGVGEYDEADALLAKSLALARQLYGNSHVATLEPLGMQAILRLAQGRLSEAEETCRLTLAIARQTRGPREKRTAYWHTVLAGILIDSGRYDEATVEARTSLDILLASAGPKHPYVASARHVLAEALAKTGAVDEAERLLLAELEALNASGAARWRVARASSALGEVLARQGRMADAQRHLAYAEATFAHAKGWPNDRELRWTARRIAEAAAMQSARFSRLALGGKGT